MTQQGINNASMLKVGTILRGTYRIDSYLSSGGFGNTYVATNVEFDERVAIKEFFMKGVTQRDDNQTTVSVSNLENTNSFQEQKEKFKKEARRLRKLQNEHIVKVHDMFDENGTAYYVMDYVDGENLSERLKRTGKPMTEKEVRDILPQILDALKSVHDAGIWHLDLKPANIMVDKAGNVKLIDFGASKQLNAQKGGATTSTAISYTNGYAPREQMEQNYDKFGPWTDIYALGATLYNLLTNNKPPLPTDIDDDMSEDKHNALPFPENVGGMKYLVLQMMKTNRLQRPQNIDAIISADKIMKEEPKQTPKSTETSQTSSARDDEATIISESRTNKQKECKHPNSDYTPKHDTEKSSTVSIDDKEEITNIKGIVTMFAIVFGVIFIAAYSNYKQNNGFVENKEYQNDWGVGVFTGNLKDGVPNGQGTVRYNDGSEYKGGFHDGLPNGKGTYKNSKGHLVFEGVYGNGKRARGTHYADDGTVLFKGTYNRDGIRLEGFGVETGNNSDGSTWRWEGEYKEAQWNGKGTITWSNGKKYEGDWKDGNRTGNGTYTFNEKRKGWGYKYVGGFLNGEFHGNGKWYYVGGGSEKCKYKNGKQI